VAGTFNIAGDAGATYLVTFTYETPAGDPVNLTGYSATAAFGPQLGATKSFLVVSTTAQNGLSIPDPPNGQIILALSATQTQALWAQSPSGFWLLEIANGGSPPVVTCLLKGAFSFSGGIPTT
jgi:hypothetical protein